MDFTNMKFNDPEVVESLCYQLRMADYPRGNNRALINNLFNGMPPYTEREEEENEIKINVNFLETTSMSHEARSQFYQSVMKPGNYFSCKTDSGPIHKRREWGIIRTEEMNRPMKKSIIYTETMRSKIALNVLHGISPAGWRDERRDMARNAPSDRWLRRHAVTRRCPGQYKGSGPR